MKFPLQSLAAAADAIASSLLDSKDSRAVAELALQAYFNEEARRAHGHDFLAKTKDGKEVRVHMEDKGDVVPGFRKREDGNFDRYEAFTSYFVWGDQKTYSQVSKETAVASGDVAAFRLQEDMAHLEWLGIDTSVPFVDLELN